MARPPRPLPPREHLIVDKLLTALNMARRHGVDMVDLSKKLADGQISEHEKAQLRAAVRRNLDRAEKEERAQLLRGMADRMKVTAAEAAKDAEDTKHPKLQRIAKDLAKKLERLEAEAKAAEAEFAA